MNQDTFKTQVIGLNRATIPAKTMKYLKLKEGDWIEITIKSLSYKRANR